MMQRRAFIVAVAGLLGPVSGAAQTPVLHLGILLFGTPDTDPNLTAFRQGLAALGYVEARNLAIQYRYAARQASGDLQVVGNHHDRRTGSVQIEQQAHHTLTRMAVQRTGWLIGE